MSSAITSTSVFTCCRRHQAQTYAHVTLLTSRYPSLSGVA